MSLRIFFPKFAGRHVHPRGLSIYEPPWITQFRPKSTSSIPSKSGKSSPVKKQISKDHVRKLLRPRSGLITAESKAQIKTPKSLRETVKEMESELTETFPDLEARIIRNRTRILRPGLWAASAVIGTYVALAYWDSRRNPNASKTDTSLLPRAQLPQTWYLTPTVIREGVKAGWKEMDKLTIGLVVVNVAIHLTKKSPFPFWGILPHVTGGKQYTLFTYPYAHSSWLHLASNVFGLCWFLPGVVHLFDGDLFHAAAFYTSVPIVTGYLQHFGFRWGWTKGLPMNMGASGGVAAILGAYCMTYPNEKVWLGPAVLILRLDVIYWLAVLVAKDSMFTFTNMAKQSRPASFVHILSLALGAGYVYFDGKNNIWKPLVGLVTKGKSSEASHE